jgi:ATP synthase protein I
VSDPGPPPGPSGDPGGDPGRPEDADADGAERPLHGALSPRGEGVAWSALGSLLAGPIVWGGVGYLLDQWLGTGRVLTAIGVVVGSLTAFYIVYLRFGRDG